MADFPELMKRALPRDGSFLSPEIFVFNAEERAVKLTYMATKPAIFYYKRPRGDKVT